ncbi:MAG: hypothetical protein QM756_26565 [Polyangiaceae bacterium]
MTKTPIADKMAELRAKSPLLVTLYLQDPANRRALEIEQSEARAAAEAQAHKADAEEIQELERRGAAKTAQLRRLEREGRGTEAAIFAQANTYHLNREASQLADEDLDPPPQAA